MDGLGHCGACHTPKNLIGGDEDGAALQGGLLQGWYAPNITGDQDRGLGTWSAEDVVAYLKTGHGKTAIAEGPMAEVVTYSTSKMTETDLNAIAVYLKDLPGQAAAPAAPEDPPAMRAGEALYADNCSACHAPRGGRIGGLFPALAHAPSVRNDDATDLIRVVLQGGQAVATGARPTGPAMPSFGYKLNDNEVAAVVTYVRNTWGDAAPAVSASDARALREALARATD